MCNWRPDPAPPHDRVTAVSLAYKNAPATLEMNGFLIEAARIPHSGWANGRVDIENIA